MTTRSILNSVLNDYNGRLDRSSLRTFLYEVMAIINSRPLTYQSLNDPKSLEPLTPSHLLSMKNKTLLPPPGNFVEEEIYARKRWRKVQFLAEQFWSRWRKENLINLNSRQKWFQPKRNLKNGDIVIVQQESSTERLAPWQCHGYFNRSTRSRSFCGDKAWIQKSSEEGKRHKFSYHRKTSAKGFPPVGRRGLRQVPMTTLGVRSKITHDCYVPFRIINNLVGV